MLLCVCHCKAVMEEADIRSAEVKKSSYEFERDIVKGAVNQVLLYKIKIHISLEKRQFGVEFVSKVKNIFTDYMYTLYVDITENQ